MLNVERRQSRSLIARGAFVLLALAGAAAFLALGLPQEPSEKGEVSLHPSAPAEERGERHAANALGEIQDRSSPAAPQAEDATSRPPALPEESGKPRSLAALGEIRGQPEAATPEAEDTVSRPPAPPEKGGKPRPLVVLSEIHYHPDTSMPDAEFIELWNVSSEPADLSGWSFTRGVEFTFPEGFRLEPGAFAVICEDEEGFRSAFGSKAAVAGTYAGKLENAGERLRLSDGSGNAVTDVHYLDVPPWPAEADGGGMSLSRISATRDADDPGAWVAARPTPGGRNSVRQDISRLSIYKLRHEPKTPGPGEPVKITASVHPRGAKARITLSYEIGGVRRTATFVERPDAASGAGRAPPDEDPVFCATLPGMPAGTLVRYWAQASEGNALVARAPAADAPTPNRACWVQDPATIVETELPLYTLLVEPRDLNLLRSGARSSQLRPAVFICEGEVHDRVQVRCRGAWARSWPKKAWKIIFPKDHPFRNQRRINLNSGWRDPAFIREALSYELFKEAGALSLDSRMVRVHVNGDFWGLFVEVEQPKERYLARNGLRGAVLYKACSPSWTADEGALPSPDDYRVHYSRETQKDSSYEDIWKFTNELARAKDLVGFFETHLDLPRYINYVCACVFTQDWDTYTKNHFIAFDVLGTKKWYVIPWDLDRTLGDVSQSDFDGTTQSMLLGTQEFPGPTGWNKILDRFLSEPRLRKRFHDRLRELLQTTFTEEKIGARIEGWKQAIAAEADLDRRRWGSWSGDRDWRSGADQLKTYVRERRAFLLAELPGGEPRPPRNLKPAPGTTVSTFPAILSGSPYAHEDPKVRHAASCWQVRERDQTYSTPLVDQRSEENLASLPLVKGVLLPRKTYCWRVAHVGTNGKVSEFSEETSFTTGDFRIDFVPFDLSMHFNRDVVASPGEPLPGGETVDENEGVMIVEGYDGSSTSNRLAGGLPRDRKLGMHFLGDYRGRNALQLTSVDVDAVRIAVRQGRYSFVRFLVAGGGGDSRMPVSFEYADGTRKREEIPCDDWYDDNPPDGQAGSLQSGVRPILNGMDRIRGGQFKDRNDPAIFEVSVPTDARKNLRAFVLLPQEATFKKPGGTRFNFLAATDIQVDTDG